MSAIDAIFDDLIALGARRDYGSPVDEWRAVHDGCAAFAAFHRSFSSARGDDRFDFFQGMLTNDVRAVTPGHGIPAAFLTDTAKVIADLRLHCREADFLLDCVAWNQAALAQRLEKYIIADDVEIDAADVAPLVALEGPRALDVATSLSGCDAGDLSPLQSRAFSSHGADLWLCRVSELAGEGVLVFGATGERDAVLGACADSGAQRAGLDALQIARVEAGVAWAGVDMGEDTLLMEIGLEAAVSRTKGCYLGQEVVERVNARGRVNRRLVSFDIDASVEALTLPAEVRAGDAAVGTITSAVQVPGRQGTRGLGLLHRKGSEAAELRVAGAGAGAESYACRLVSKGS